MRSSRSCVRCSPRRGTGSELLNSGVGGFDGPGVCDAGAVSSCQQLRWRPAWHPRNSLPPVLLYGRSQG